MIVPASIVKVTPDAIFKLPFTKYGEPDAVHVVSADIVPLTVVPVFVVTWIWLLQSPVLEELLAGER